MSGIALGVQYDGSLFHGFQRQQGLATVQAALEDAVSSVANEPISITAAGRTDRGVHATQQVVSFQSNAARTMRAWRQGVNSQLPAGIAVNWVQEVEPDFNARFEALWRRYLYVFGEQQHYLVFLRDFVTWLDDVLDWQRMNSVCGVFLGEQDFSAIRAANCSSKSPSRYIYHLAVIRIDNYIIVDVVANAFLLHMVRNLAGVLRAVGIGQISKQQVADLLAARDRRLAPATAASAGLYLVEVGYDARHGLTSGLQLPAMLGSKQQLFADVELPADYFKKAKSI